MLFASVIFPLLLVVAGQVPAAEKPAELRVGAEFALASPLPAGGDPAAELATGDLLTIRSLAEDSVEAYSSDLERTVKLPRAILSGQGVVPIKSALSLYSRLIDEKPQSKWHRRRAVVRHASLDWQTALADWSAAIKLDPLDFKAWLGRAVAHRQLRKHDEALADATQATELKPDFASAWNERASANMALMKWNEALADYDTYVVLSPKSAAALRARGFFHLIRKNYVKAREDFGEALTIDPKDVAAWHLHGQTYYWVGMYAEAVADYTRAIELQPKYSPPYFDRAVVYITRKENDKAILDLNTVIALAPAQASAYQNRAIANSNLGKLDAAIADYRKVSELAPTSLVPLQQIVILLGRAKQWPEQAEAIGVLIDREPAVLAHRLNRAKAWQQAGKSEQALEDLTFVVDKGAAAEQMRALVQRADLKLQQRRYQEAVADCDEAIGRGTSPDDPAVAPALIGRAWIRSAADDPAIRDGKQAILDATRACAAVGWEDAHRLAVLAAANAEAGRFDDAAAWQQMAIDQLSKSMPTGPSTTREDAQRLLTEMKTRLAVFAAKQAIRIPAP